ncbi:MAG: DUF120 domain-containing protein [Promethearchaeota archaeon]
METSLWFVLLRLAEIGREIEISSVKMAGMLGLSQQTASRHLQELEKMDWITREVSRKGQKVEITETGMNALRAVYISLSTIFEGHLAPFEIKGEVFEGMGEGAYYVSREGYSRQFKTKLGFEPFAGTLNIRVKTQDDLRARKMLDLLPGIVIEGFTNEGRSFGSVKCHRVVVDGKVEGAVIFIRRTHYGNDVLEIISPANLRKKLGLEDGDIVSLTVVAERAEVK